ncbi:MAG TPA: hypothetical protein VE891_02365 [Allosphingosinicella sp.]|nr:hypothetical protein [Allosphingosinicella sp.]
MATGLYAEDFRLANYTDKQTLEAAFAAWRLKSGELHLEAGKTYDLGEKADGNIVFPALINFRDAILCGNGATILVKTTVSDAWNLTYMYGLKNVAFKDLCFRDSGYNPTLQFKGGKVFVFDGDGGACSNLCFSNIRIDGAVAAITCQGMADNSPRVSGIYIEPSCRFDNCFYGLSCSENGDDITGGYTAFNPVRAYFPYGVSGHDLDIRIISDGSGATSESCCLIKRYKYDTKNIRAKFLFSGTFKLSPDAGTTPGCFVKIEMQPLAETAPGRIDNIDLTIEIDRGVANTHNAHVLGFKSYVQTGINGNVRSWAEETGSTDNIWSNIRLDGCLSNTLHGNVKAYVSPSTPCTISLAPALTGAAPQHLPQRSGFIFKPAADREFYLRSGDITAAPVKIDLAGLDSSAFTLKVKTYAHGAASGLASQDSVYREDIVAGYNAGGSQPVAILGTPREAFLPYVKGTPPGVSFDAIGENLTVSFSGSAYSSTAFARVEVEYVGRGKLTG